ncbi:MAG: septum formation initiator family protein [Bacteroidales bacterium]|nr:septum formation initiator family protein [Bacteroidales bacterium]
MEENTKKRRTIKYLLIYGGTIAVFLCYLFISDHTLRTHKDLNRKISNLERKIENTKHQVGNIYTYDQLSSDSVLLEKYVREQLNMHKTDEDVFIVVYE